MNTFAGERESNTSWKVDKIIAAILSINPAMGASVFPVALAMKLSKLFGMLAQVAPRLSRVLTSSSVGASFAGKMTCIWSLHPAQL